MGQYLAPYFSLIVLSLLISTLLPFVVMLVAKSHTLSIYRWPGLTVLCD